MLFFVPSGMEVSLTYWKGGTDGQVLRAWTLGPGSLLPFSHTIAMAQ